MLPVKEAGHLPVERVNFNRSVPRKFLFVGFVRFYGMAYYVIFTFRSLVDLVGSFRRAETDAALNGRLRMVSEDL